MLRGGIPIGRVFGISLRLHYSWFVVFALITWLLAANYFPATQPNWSLTEKIVAGLVTSVLFFGSVLLHELVHSLVALREGIQIESITLFILGGVSQMEGEPKTARDEFLMAGAGPLSSLVLGGIFYGVSFALRGTATGTAQFGSAIASYLGFINILLGVFNLIPGFPLDGGRVLRSLLWWRGKNLQRATRIASTIGRIFGFLFIFAGIWRLFSGDFFNGIWLILIGWFLQSAAAGGYQQTLLQEMLRGHVAGDVMSRDCMVVSPDITIERLVNENILTSGRRCFPVISDGRIEGLVTMHNIRAVPREQWATRSVREAMTSLDSMKSVGPDEDLNTVMQLMAQNDINQLPVISEGKVVGIIGRDNIISFVNTRAELQK
jgi:Zn-dependent protease/CBS domain-containing protein